MAQHAALTIVSKNYFAFARTLAESYLSQHPGNDFLIVLVDKADGHVPERLECGAQVIEMADLQIPDLSRFIYRYSIMELNTAVKPFALADLFERFGYETLLYIDPDIWVFEPLTEIYLALESASIVLTPHMRRPYFDTDTPADVHILQSGTYNLGFVGLRRGETSQRMLDWWMGKLFLDCTVDIPNGLFVDQKWIDLVPGFFPDHKIVYHSGYNAAYWNLHERPVSRSSGGFMVGGMPLVFFHFSGYVPYAPNTLSKHQNRHVLKDLPELKALTDAYSRELIRNGYEDSSLWPYAFERLSNGVRLPLDIVARVMQWCARASVETPCPVTDPDAFCAFLMSRNIVPDHPGAVLIFHFLLQMRGDVAAAFPGAAADSDDAGFRKWIETSGTAEHKLADLLPFESSDVEEYGVEDLLSRVRASGDPVAIERLEAFWDGGAAAEAFLDWAADDGPFVANLMPEHVRRLRDAMPAARRLLHIYFLRGDLQSAYPCPWESNQVDRLADWFLQNRYVIRVSRDDVAMFRGFATSRPELMVKACLLYQHKGQTNRREPSIYAIDQRRFEIGCPVPTDKVLEWLKTEPAIPAIDHYVAFHGRDESVLEDFSRGLIAGVDPRKSLDFVKRVKAEFVERRGRRLANVAGYMDAPTGMGESGRSMLATLASSNLSVRPFTLPTMSVLTRGLPTGPAIFGWPAADPDVSITVVNADAVQAAETLLPASYWGGKNIGFWVWETEALPLRFARSQKRFDEIWTASNYSAAAIRRAVEVSVHVVPHTLDFMAIDRAQPSRKRFGLPEDAVLYGFAFDPASVIERKNVAGLIRAFLEATRASDRCYLVLKANGRPRSGYDYETIRAMARSDRILFLEDELDRADTYDFLASLDVYVSLHRAEGFGLTCAESMAIGRPVIATGYSGNVDFMDAKTSLLIPARVIETERPYGPYPAGTRWADPDHQAAIEAIRSLLDADRRRHIGELASRHVREVLSTQRLADRVAKLIEDTTSAETKSASGRVAAMV